MDEHRIEDALRAGPPDEREHRRGALQRALAERERAGVASTFQVRLRAERPLRPWLPLAVAAALVVVVASVVTVGGAGPAGSTGPSPSSVRSPSATEAGRGAPADLVDRWVGPVRHIDGLEPPARRAFLDIQGIALHLDPGFGPSNVLASTVDRAGAGLLRLTATSPNVGCEPFEEGTYRWSLSTGGTNLTLTVRSDACAQRAAVLPGTWTHTACRNASADCLGPIEAGQYTSSEFDPFGTGSAGQLRYAVPDGWSNTADQGTNYSLRPTADYQADPGADGGDTVSGIYVWAGTVATDQPTDCAPRPAAGVAVTADAIANHIRSLDGVTVTDRGTIQIDGRRARVLDLALDPSYRTPCPWSGGDPFRALIMFADLGADGGVQGVAPGEQARIYFVDVAAARVVSIWVDAPASRFDELIAGAGPIVASLVFEDAQPSR